MIIGCWTVLPRKRCGSACAGKYDEKPLNRFLARNVSGFSSSLENNLAQMQFSYLKDKADSGGIVCGSWTMCGDGFKGI